MPWGAEATIARFESAANDWQALVLQGYPVPSIGFAEWLGSGGAAP